MRLPSTSAAAALAALVLIAPDAARADCGALDRELRTAVSSAETDRFPELHERMLADATCDGAYRKTVGRVLALAKLKAMQSRAGTDGELPKAELVTAAGYGQPWQVMAALGDAEYAGEQWTQAVQAYESALDDLRDPIANPMAPDRAVEERIAKRAYQARALAPTYVATRRFRGKPSGLASPNFRSFTAEVVPVPIRFPYNEAVLTAEGEAAAKDILDFLASEKANAVRIIGHTDPKGTPSYNKQLSSERAKAVAAYLKTHGYGGQVLVAARGEEEPFQPDDPKKYTEEQRHAFDRRVEYQLVTQP